MWLKEKFDLRYPLIQGGMAHIATPAFAASVSEAGALGVIATGSMDAKAVKEAIDKYRSLSSKPFGVNLMMMNPDIQAIAQLLVEEKVPLITTGAGSPGSYIEQWHKAGSCVIPVVSNLGLAERLQRSGVDAVIAEGQEAGGHIGEQTSMVLWPRLAKELSIPVIGAGGIAGPEQIMAGASMGLQGFQVGTILLATEECPVHENYKQAVLKARENQIHVLGRIKGIPCRVLKNPLSRHYLSREQEGTDLEELERLLLGSLRTAVHDGNMKNGCFMMGLAAAQIQEIKPLSQVLNELFPESVLNSLVN